MKLPVALSVLKFEMPKDTVPISGIIIPEISLEREAKELCIPVLRKTHWTLLLPVSLG